MGIGTTIIRFFRSKKFNKEKDDKYDPHLDDAVLTKSNVFKAIRPDTYSEAYYQFLSSWDKNLIPHDENSLK